MGHRILAVTSAGLLLWSPAAPALAQQSPKPEAPARPASATAAPGKGTAPAAVPKPDPCPIPYAVGEQVKGGELEARFGGGALSKLVKLPDIEGRGGAEVVRTAYAGITSQAMSAVFDAYACRIKGFIVKTAPPEAASKSAAVDRGLVRLRLEMGLIQNAAEQGTEALTIIRDGYLDAETRAANAPVLDATITKAALADVNSNALFISQVTKQQWIGLKVGPHISAQACGGVVQAAISDGGSSLQRALASAQSILINYLDPNTPPNVALADLFVHASASPIKKATADHISFKDCTKALAAAQPAKPLAPSAPPPAPAPSPAQTPKS